MIAQEVPHVPKSKPSAPLYDKDVLDAMGDSYVNAEEVNTEGWDIDQMRKDGKGRKYLMEG